MISSVASALELGRVMEAAERLLQEPPKRISQQDREDVLILAAFSLNALQHIENIETRERAAQDNAAAADRLRQERDKARMEADAAKAEVVTLKRIFSSLGQAVVSAAGGYVACDRRHDDW